MEVEIKTVYPIRDPIEKRSVQLQQDLRIMKDYLLMCARKEEWRDGCVGGHARDRRHAIRTELIPSAMYGADSG